MRTVCDAPRGVDDYARLQEAAELIARHPDYPGKRAVESMVVREIDELHRAGRLDDVQRLSLRDLLGCPAESN
jgi:hypothetical protein